MKKQYLDFDCDYNFMLFAISSVEPDYKFCLHLNQVLNLHLAKEFPLTLTNDNFEDDFLFSYYSYFHDDLQINYQLIANRSYNLVNEKKQANKIPQPGLFDEANDSVNGKINFFIPELSSYDYLFVIRSSYHASFAKKIEASISSISSILKVDYFEVNDLESKDNLIWE